MSASNHTGISGLLDRLRSLPVWARWSLRIALMLVLVNTAVKYLAMYLSVGTVTEAYPWFFWGEAYLDLAEFMYVEGRFLLFVALCVVCWWLLGKLFAAPRRERHGVGGVLVGVFRLGWLMVVVASLGLLVAPATVNAVRLVRNWPPRTNQPLLDNCGYCHSPYRPQHFIKSPELWRRTVKRMRERNGAPVNDEQAEQVLDWLLSYRSFPDAWMFKAKCERCHSVHHLLETPRTAAEWREIVDRVGWLSPFGFRVDQKEQVKQHLVAELSVPEPVEGDPGYEDYRMRRDLAASCNPCHGLSLIFEKDALEDAEAMIGRMSYKDPDLVPEDRIEEFAEALKKLAADEESFDRLFPHDKLLDLVP